MPGVAHGRPRLSAGGGADADDWLVHEVHGDLVLHQGAVEPNKDAVEAVDVDAAEDSHARVGGDGLGQAVLGEEVIVDPSRSRRATGAAIVVVFTVCSPSSVRAQAPAPRWRVAGGARESGHGQEWAPWLIAWHRRRRIPARRRGRRGGCRRSPGTYGGSLLRGMGRAAHLVGWGGVSGWRACWTSSKMPKVRDFGNLCVDQIGKRACRRRGADFGAILDVRRQPVDGHDGCRRHPRRELVTDGLPDLCGVRSGDLDVGGGGDPPRAAVRVGDGVGEVLQVVVVGVVAPVEVGGGEGTAELGAAFRSGVSERCRGSSLLVSRNRTGGAWGPAAAPPGWEGGGQYSSPTTSAMAWPIAGRSAVEVKGRWTLSPWASLRM